MSKGETISPDFWGSHGFNDQCPWTEGEFVYPPLTDAEMLDAQTKLRKYIEYGLGKAVRRFQEGETFTVANVPLGTVLNYSYDYAEKGLFGPPSLDQIKDEWGIITQEAATGDRLIIGFEREDIYNEFDPDNASSLYGHPEITIGEVIHIRARSSNVVRARYESLTRFNELELWERKQGFI